PCTTLFRSGRVVLSPGSLEAARPTAPSRTRNRRAGIAGRDRYPGDSVPVPTGLQLAYEGGPGGCSEGEYGAVGCLAVTDGGEAGGSGGHLDAIAALLIAVAALVPSGDVRIGSGRACHRSEEHTSELQSRENLVCRLLL